jgi:hypothetical protein
VRQLAVLDVPELLPAAAEAGAFLSVPPDFLSVPPDEEPEPLPLLDAPFDVPEPDVDDAVVGSLRLSVR